MDKIRRNERMSAMMKILAAKPNRIFTLSYFCDLFGSAKSTMSEDIDILRDVVAHFGLGELETVTGAAGGVRYRTKVRRPEARKFIGDLCQQLKKGAFCPAASSITATFSPRPKSSPAWAKSWRRNTMPPRRILC